MPPKPETGRSAAVIRVCTLTIDFRAQHEPLTKLPRDSKAALPEIMIALAGVDRIAAAAEDRPGALIFLDPDGQEAGHRSGAHSVASRGQGHGREHGDLKARRLVVVKPILDRELQIAGA